MPNLPRGSSAHSSIKLAQELSSMGIAPNQGMGFTKKLQTKEPD
jgi:hypothetical protein